MKKILVYDIPTRLFHWLFSCLFLFSFIVGKSVDDESDVFIYHMLSGLLIGGLVLWRFIWGIFGTENAKFSGFELRPSQLIQYFKGILSGSKLKWAGHNPASSWAAVVMFILAFGLAASGYFMTRGWRESLEDIHEIMANSFIIIVVLHILGIVIHSARHQDQIGLSMVHGHKNLTNVQADRVDSRPFAAVVLVVGFIVALLFLKNNYDSGTKTLVLFGQTLEMGSEEENEESEHGDHESYEKEDEEQDEDAVTEKD